MQEIEKHIRGNAKWTEFMKSKPERDQDPRDYMVRRSGWILPGHFGGKSGGLITLSTGNHANKVNYKKC